MTADVWAFDVDGCLVDSMTGTSLRPHAHELLTALRLRGHPLVLWSAGGREHAESVAQRHGLRELFDGVYDKLGQDIGGRRLTDHLPQRHQPAVAVDDRPGEIPLTAVAMPVPPYMTPDADDRGLLHLLRQAQRQPNEESA